MKNVRVLAILPFLFALGLSGDTIELKTGERIEGTFKQATSAGAVIDVGGQPITIPLEKVKAIYFGPVPSASPTAPPPARDALDALRGLQSVVESGLTYRDYATRVLDAKVKVDRYLSSSPNDPPELRKTIEIAMREYELAGQSWNLQGNESAYRSLITPNLLERCPAVAKIIEGERLKVALAMGTVGMLDDAMDMIKVDGQYAHRVLWKCAITEGVEAERLLAHR
jgi:hypothetical protein